VIGPFYDHSGRGKKDNKQYSNIYISSAAADGTSKSVAGNTVFVETHYFLSKGSTSIHLYYLKKMNAEDVYTD